MEHGDHGQTARDFLDASDAEFAAGDRLQASEKLWGAASHAVMAAALQRDLSCRTHRALSNVVQQLITETGESDLLAGFFAAEKFHKNFYHDEMESYEIDVARPVVHRFVRRVLELPTPAA